MNNTNEPNNEPGQPYPWETIEDPLAEAVRLADSILYACTGHDDYQRRKIAYYALATHFIPMFDPFPGLVIYGLPSTGKSATLSILRRLCYRTLSITGEAITPAALRKCMAEANKGTLIVEEAEKISRTDMENLLIIRYSQDSALTTKMIQDMIGWELEQLATYGATVCHMRYLFKDPALMRRVITVRTKSINRKYDRMNKHRASFELYHEKVKNLPVLPNVDNIWNIEPGIFDCYLPLLTLAIYLDDEDFTNSLLAEMGIATNRLKEGEAYLEAPILLKAIISLVSDKIKGSPTLGRINIEMRYINPALRDELGPNHPVFLLSSYQRNLIIKEDLGFGISSSHGRQRIYLTIPLLIKACDEYNIHDDIIDEWKKALNIK
jgi:hypothetical protein